MTEHLFTNFTTSCHIWFSSRQGGTRVESRIHYEHLSVANSFMNNPHVFAQKYNPQTEADPSAHAWLRCDLDCRCMYSSLNYSCIIRLLSIDQTKGYENSYRSHANQSFESTPDSLTVYTTSLRTQGNFPGHGSLTSIDSSRYLSDTF